MINCAKPSRFGNLEGFEYSEKRELKKAINQTILTDIRNNDNEAYAAEVKLDRAIHSQ